MNVSAFVVGIAVAVLLIWIYRNSPFEYKKWVYALILVTFPFYYWLFAAIASDYTALTFEALIGLVFFALAYGASKSKAVIGFYLLATGYIGHGVYDIFHDGLFINAGSPLWWPEFCGAVDVFVGLYLIYLARSSNPSSEASP